MNFLGPGKFPFCQDKKAFCFLTCLAFCLFQKNSTKMVKYFMLVGFKPDGFLVPLGGLSQVLGIVLSPGCAGEVGKPCAGGEFLGQGRYLLAQRLDSISLLGCKSKARYDITLVGFKPKGF